MNETNDIRYSNEGQVEQPNYIRYTNDDIPYNEVEGYQESVGYREFGATSPSGEDGEDAGPHRRLTEHDMVKVASTFAVVTIVAMAVVLDESPFGSFFDPIMGVISESFGITHEEAGYAGDVEISLLVTDDEIDYRIYFTIDPGPNVVMKVTNNFTDRVVPMPDEESWSGSVTGLARGMEYRVTVEVDGKAAATRTVSTLASYDAAPSFELVYARCYCIEEGTFHLMVNVIDRNGVWSDFRAEIIDEEGFVVEHDFAGNVNDLQKIPTNGLKMPGTATLVVSCTEHGSEDSAVKTLCTATVNI